MDKAITQLTARQHGAVSRQQLLADGVADEQVRTLVRRGRLTRASYGTYTLPGSPATPEQQMMVALLRCGPGARVAGERLLAILGIRGAARDGPFTVLTRPGRRLSTVPWSRRPDLIPMRHHASIDGLASVTPARNLVEAAVDLPTPRVEVLVDGMRWDRRGLAATRRLVEQHADHPGAVVLTGTGLLAHDAGESPPERRLVVLVDHHEPRTQVWLSSAIRVDVLLPAARLVIEYHGRWTHGAAAQVRDTDRRRAIQALGYAVLDLWDRDLRNEDALLTRIDTLVAALAG